MNLNPIANINSKYRFDEPEKKSMKVICLKSNPEISRNQIKIEKLVITDLKLYYHLTSKDLIKSNIKTRLFEKTRDISKKILLNTFLLKIFKVPIKKLPKLKFYFYLDRFMYTNRFEIVKILSINPIIPIICNILKDKIF